MKTGLDPSVDEGYDCWSIRRQQQRLLHPHPKRSAVFFAACAGRKSVAGVYGGSIGDIFNFQDARMGDGIRYHELHR